ncbi:MAG TPA: hypothetical protein VLF91_04210 [Candidatus Saccharimonadales bacterium]|nr:hypothetical protein [Candidatus Saccharimonadales bacterium]
MKAQIKGSVFLLIVVGIPLAFIFTPVVIVFFIVGALWGIVRESRAGSMPRKTKVQARRPKLSKDDEELITAILPVINGKH